MTTLAPDKLEQLKAITLDRGSHGDLLDGVCAMEAAAYIAGEPWSDHPKCVAPVIAAFMRGWNDQLPDNGERDRLLKPLIPRLIGTATTPAAEERRTWMLIDWLIRDFTPPWLRLAKLNVEADALEAVAEIDSVERVPSAMRAIRAAQRSAAAAGEPAGDAVRDAARGADWAAVCATAGEPATDTASTVASAAAYAASGAAARGAAEKALAATVAERQLSAVELVKRMCAA